MHANAVLKKLQQLRTVESLIADTPIKRTPNSGLYCFFYKIHVLVTY